MMATLRMSVRRIVPEVESPGNAAVAKKAGADEWAVGAVDMKGSGPALDGQPAKREAGNEGRARP